METVVVDYTHPVLQSNQKIKRVKQQNVVQKAYLATPDVLSYLFGFLWYFASKKSSRDSGDVTRRTCTLIESGPTGLVQFHYNHNKQLLVFMAKVLTGVDPLSVVENSSVADFAGVNELSKIFVLPPNNECLILIKGEMFYKITGFNIVIRIEFTHIATVYIMLMS